jgi:site-specific DNA recombinase
VYREKHTGVELWERPQLTRLREAVRRHEVDVVVAHSIDRLSRDPTHLGVIISEAGHHGVAVEFVTEPLDDSPEGQLIRFVRGYAAEVEHEKIRERVMRGRLASARGGKLQHGPRPRYGYRWHATAAGTYVEDPLTAAVVRRLFATALEGGALRRMAIDLTEAGVPSPGGRSVWDFTTISRILRDPIYAGTAVAFRTKRVKVTGVKSGRVVARDEAERIALPSGTAPPLVDRIVFDAVQEQIPRRRQQATRRALNPEAYLLRGGYARCGHCGGVMVLNHKQGYGFYVCNAAKRFPGRCGFHAISTSLLDEVVWTRIWATLNQPERIEAEVARRREAGDPTTDADLAAVEGNLAELERDRARQVRLLDKLSDLDDEETLAEIKGRLRHLAQRKRELEAERTGVLSRRERWEADQARLGSLAAWCERVKTRLAGFDYAKKRLALDAFDVRVTVWRADHSPRWRVTADPSLDEPDEACSVLRTGSRRPRACTARSRRR